MWFAIPTRISRPSALTLKEDSTVWIDKKRKTVLKTLSHPQGYLLPAHIPISIQTTVTYEVVKLDQEERASSFTFVAPSDAKLVSEFPDPFQGSPAAVRLVGKVAPELSLKTSDGKVMTLSSFRGPPVFLEFWATWCEPCV